MSIKLGNTDALLYLGDQIADRAYLGTAQVPRVLYFSDVVDDDWDEIGNWFFNVDNTVAATSLPTEVDSVVASGELAASGQTVANFTFTGSTFSGTLTVTGKATFNGAFENYGTVTGNAVFNEESKNVGTINGNAVFNGDSSNNPLGTVNGNATFNDFSENGGTINGNATFNDNSGNDGTVTGTITDNR